MATPTLVSAGYGNPVVYGGHIQNAWSNNQGDNIVVSPTAGNTLVVFVFGFRTYDPFNLFHNTTPVVPTGWSVGINDMTLTPTITDNSGDSVAVTSVTETTTALTLTDVNTAVGGSAVYDGTITGGAANALAGYKFQVAGFTTAANNGTFLCTASTATSLTLSNAAAVAETHAATATYSSVALTTASNNFGVGDVVVLAGFTTQTWLNGQSQAVVSSGSTFKVNDSTFHATSGPTAQAAATAARNSGNDWVTVTGKVQNGDVDYTPSGVTDFTVSSKWDLNGKYPSVIAYYATNVSGGTYNLNVNSCYQDGTIRPGDLAAGKPYFDGGVDIHVLEFSGLLTSGIGDQSAGAMTASNPATVSYTTAASGDLILTGGLMKNGNAFSTYAPVGTTGTLMLATGKGVSSQAHWGIQMQLQTANGAITPGFTNPLGYEMAVVSLALKHA